MAVVWWCNEGSNILEAMTGFLVAGSTFQFFPFPILLLVSDQVVSEHHESSYQHEGEQNILGPCRRLHFDPSPRLSNSGSHRPPSNTRYRRLMPGRREHQGSGSGYVLTLLPSLDSDSLDPTRECPAPDFRIEGAKTSDHRPRGGRTLRRGNVGTVMWELFRRKPQSKKEVTTGRFEIERNGEVAYLDYSLSGNILELIHTEVPKKLRGMGLASSLAESALLWAKERNLKVDIICPLVQEYLAKHPEYSDLVLH
jgi:predicted GNAT family acetyltransferase